MEPVKPIRRSKELSSLSREHHDGLLLSWKINMGLSIDVSTDRICSYVLYFFDNNLNAHFDKEEQYIFSLVGPGDTHRAEAEMHHKMLKGMINNFRNVDQVMPLSLKYFAEILTMHIRYEERVLFPIIEKQTDHEILKEAGKSMGIHVKCSTEWHDQFWLNENQQICSQKPVSTQ